jgi:hypothetical protein
VRDRLFRLADAINRFAALLAVGTDQHEAVFHAFLVEHPILLDVYGIVESKPRFVYPEGESPLGKQYVEPDFIVRYPGQRYRLIELERPAKQLATRDGHPRVGVTQAAFSLGSGWTSSTITMSSYAIGTRGYRRSHKPASSLVDRPRRGPATATYRGTKR